jgi:Ca-activated chloride channel family protein
VGALITREAELLSLNASGKLRTLLEIVGPEDGMVLSDHPVLLLDPAKRDACDRTVDRLKSEPVQEKITERTLRRPIVPGVPRIAGRRFRKIEESPQTTVRWRSSDRVRATRPPVGSPL